MSNCHHIHSHNQHKHNVFSFKISKLHRILLIAIILLVLPHNAFTQTQTPLTIDNYSFTQLNPTEQIAYQAIEDCITHLTPSWDCGSITQDTIQKAYDSLLLDHPEYYWTDSYTYVTSYINNVISGHRVEFSYTMTANQISRTNSEITQALYDIVDSLDLGDGSTYSTVKAVYDYLINTCTYDELNLDQSLYSVMVNHSGVCASFAKAFEFILQCLQIPSTTITGRLTQTQGPLSTTLGHAWNLVYIDGLWYHVDVTSGLAVSSSYDLARYRFLLIPTSEILKTHQIQNPVPIPDCSSTSLDFFKLNNLYVPTYNRSSFANALAQAATLGYQPTVKLGSRTAFADAVDDLFNNSGIFPVLKDALGLTPTTLSYLLDDSNLTIIILP